MSTETDPPTDLRHLLALKAAAFRWTTSRRPTDGSLLADAARGLIVENERLREERDQAIAHDRQPYPTPWAYDQACAALENQRERAETAEAERDRLKAALGPVPLLGEPCGSTEPAGGRLTCTLPARHDVHYAAGSGTIWRCICTPTDAEAAVARVRALAAAATRAECGGGWDLDPAAVLAALDQPAAEAETENAR